MIISRIPHSDQMWKKMVLPLMIPTMILAWGAWEHTFTPLQLFSFLPMAYGLVVFSAGAWRYQPKPPVRAIEEAWPMVTVLIPAHNEEAVIGSTLKHVLGLDYPSFEVIVIDDHSSDRTGQILQQHPVRVVTRRNLPNRGKSEALNAGLEVAQGEIICVFDADTEVAPDFLRRAVAPLVEDAGLCGVQAQVRVYNRQYNFLTASQDDEFALYNELLQLGKMQFGGAAALGGNGQLTRRSALQAVGGWSPMSLTEDLDLSVRLFLAGQGRIHHATDAVVWQEGVTDLSALVRQRTRWAEGMLRCYGEFVDVVLRSQAMSRSLRVDTLYTLLSAFLPLLTPVMVCLVAIAWCSSKAMGGISHTILDVQTLLLLGSACVWSVLVSWRRERKLAVLPALRYMVYVFHWVPAVILALRNIFRARPVVWEKTVHQGRTRHIEVLPKAVLGALQER